jgi:anaerobic magnesium-protoporphyrin IX monomethyl ester cyclase
MRKMSEIILFNPVCDPKRISFNIPPWALLYVASPLVEDGFDVSLIDQNVELGWKNRLKDELGEDTLFVGVTAMTGLQIRYALDFIKTVKELSDVPIVWGGAHASIFTEQTLNDSNVDIVVRGEGEETVRELAHAIKNGQDLKGIKGVWYKNSPKVTRNDDRGFVQMNHAKKIPFELIDVEKYVYRTDYADRNFEICTSRGCPHRCGFCYNVCFSRQKWRTMDVQDIILQLKYIVERFNLDGINWREDNFFVDKDRVAAICNAIIDENLCVKWHSDSRIDYFDRYDEEFISLLKRAGCSCITFGIESGSQKVLDCIQKDITVEQVLRVNRKMAKHSIKCMYHFSFGFMGETIDDVMQTVRLAHQLMQENPNAGIWPPSIYTPYPGTPLFEDSLRQGFVVPDRLEQFADFTWSKSNIPWLSREDAKRLRRISYIVSGYASEFPLIRMWFRFRLNHLLKAGSPGSTPERFITDRAMEAIRLSRLVASRLRLG